MRLDEGGNPCPETLGEYRAMCELVSKLTGLHRNKALVFLDKKIAESPHGKEEKVLAADSQMRALLMPMLLQEEKGDEETSKTIQ